MAESSSSAPTVTDEKSLDMKSVKPIGRGAFGQVYKARHLQWRRDVAIKILFPDHGSSSDKYLTREAEHMLRAESPHVVQVLGVFKGCLDCLPTSDFPYIGLVMELMERGSLASRQSKLNHTLPWSLVCRVSHQVALGMKHLHSLTPPLIHKDLNRENVLMDKHLNVKITDFGLSKFVNTLTSDRVKGIGTTQYMPPESFPLSYTSAPAYDVYSYGILLWSIMMGKEPYEGCRHCHIESRVLQGERPSLDEINTEQVPEVKDLVDLMERCWHQEPEQRPSFPDCCEVTKVLYERNKSGIEDAVHQVITELGPAATSTPPPEQVDGLEKPQELPGKTIAEKVQFVTQNRAKLIQKVTTVKAIADDLKDGGFIHDELYEDITTQRLDRDKVRTLYEKVLTPLGTCAQVAFYDALRVAQPGVVESLAQSQR